MAAHPRSMRPSVVTVIVACTTLTGCADADGAGLGGPSDDGGVAGAASIIGIVVDDAIRPLAGADVRIATDPPRNTTTDASGRFAFGGLEVGAYEIRATLRFHAPFATLAIAQADPSPITLVLDAVPEDRPFAEVLLYRGFLNASIVAGSPIIHQGRIGTDYPFPVVPTWLQTEVVWEPNNALATDMDLGWYRSGCEVGSGPCMNRTLGRSPLTFAEDHDDLITWRFIDEGGFGFRVLIADTEETRPPVSACDPVGLTCIAGVGLGVQQSFEVFTSAFYNYPPPAGWMFSESGELPPA